MKSRKLKPNEVSPHIFLAPGSGDRYSAEFDYGKFGVFIDYDLEDVRIEDHGIGGYEYWGAKGFHSDPGFSGDEKIVIGNIAIGTELREINLTDKPDRVTKLFRKLTDLDEKLWDHMNRVADYRDFVDDGPDPDDY